MAVEGYNIAFRILVGEEYLTIAGRTQDDLTIAARTRESLTKNDAGNTQVAVIGHDITFRATALFDVVGDSDITRDDLVDLVMEVGDDAELDFTYAAESAEDSYEQYSGKCVITNYSESSSASDLATLTVDFRVVGDMDVETVTPDEEE